MLEARGCLIPFTHIWLPSMMPGSTLPPPMGQIWESPVSSPSDSHGGSSSSVDKFYEDDGSADVAVCGGLIQGGSRVPAVYVHLSEGVVATVAGVAACRGADEIVAGCLLDKVDMEPLFTVVTTFSMSIFQHGR